MRTRGLIGGILVLIAGSIPSIAQARVIFTGYADVLYDTGLDERLQGSPAALSSVGSSPQNLVTRGFSSDSMGLFATTEIEDTLKFQTDITFEGVSGTQVNQLTLQYAYLNWTPDVNTIVNLGKITLPFGYYNENRFYPFERTTIIPPVFQADILGLPIADWGIAGIHQIPMRYWTAEGALYVVNGYGSSPGTTEDLRAPSLPGGLSLAHNIGASDNNDKPSVGGRLRLKDIGGLPVETGVSYYWGEWDASGVEPMYIAGAHVHATLDGFDFLAEALHLAARGDQGFAPNIGDTDWSTSGGFIVASYNLTQIYGKTLSPYVQTEYYRTRPDNGDAERETVRSLTGGASLRVSSQVQVKAEYLHLIYELPYAVDSTSLRLSANGALMSVVVTF